MRSALTLRLAKKHWRSLGRLESAEPVASGTVSRTRAFLSSVANSLLRSVLRRPADSGRTAAGKRGVSTSTVGKTKSQVSPDGSKPGAEPPAKGQSGPAATVEVDPRAIGQIRMSYSPKTDGDPDPGEVVWTWVPYAENDGRGKDRPVLVVATEPGGTVLAVQLTSKSHDGDREFVSLGSGPWDAEGRPSWVNIERVLRVHPAGMRREATALDALRYAKVKAALQVRYRWL